MSDSLAAILRGGNDNQLFMQDPEAAALQRRRRLAEVLAQDNPQNIRSHTQGIAHLVNVLRGNLETNAVDREARDLQGQRRAELGDFTRQMLGQVVGGQPAAPAPAPSAGNVPQAPIQSEPLPPPAAPQQPAQAPMSPSAGVTPPANMYGRNEPLAAVRDGNLGAGPVQLAALSAGRASDAGQPLYNPATAGARSEMPGRDAGVAPPTGRINPNVGAVQGQPPQPPTLASAVAGTQPQQPPAPQPQGMPTNQQLLIAALTGAQSPNPLIQRYASTLLPLATAGIQREGDRDFQRSQAADQRAFQERQLAAQQALVREGRAAEEARFGQTLGLQREQLEETRRRNTATDARIGIPDGYRRTPEGNLQAIPGGPADPDVLEGRTRAQAAGRPVPPAIQRAEQEDLEAIGAASGVNSRLTDMMSRIQSGALSLGPVANRVAGAQNALGLSSENSRNFATFQATLENLRNESLRLNRGVQTEGDAIRAWNELVNNINDPLVVQQRLAEIRQLNDRAIQQRQLMIQHRRETNGLQPLDTSQFVAPAPATPQQPGAPTRPGPTPGSTASPPPPPGFEIVR